MADNKDIEIRVAVAFKAAVETYNSNPELFETSDAGLEIKDFTSILYDVLVAVEEEKGAASGKSRGRSSGNSPNGSRRGGTSSGSSRQQSGSRKPKDPSKPASERQVAAIEKLLNRNNVDFDDDGFTLDGVDYAWDELTMGNVQPVFDYFAD